MNIGEEIINSASSVVDYTKEVGKFLVDLKDNGIWYALTGYTFKEWVVVRGQDLLTSTLHLIIDLVDVLILPAAVLTLLAMAGSKKSKEYIYWVIITYVIIKCLALVL